MNNTDKTSRAQQNLVGAMFKDISQQLTHSQNFVKEKAQAVLGVPAQGKSTPNVYQMDQINFESTKHAGNSRHDRIMQNEQNPQFGVAAMSHFNPVMKKTAVQPILRRDGQFFQNQMPTLKKRPLQQMSDFSRNFQPAVTTHDEFVSKLITKPIIAEPDFGPISKQNEERNAQVFAGSVPLRDKKKDLKKNHSQPNQSSLKPASPIQQEKQRLLSFYQQRGAQRKVQSSLDSSLSKLLNSYSRQSETATFHQALKDKQIQKHKISKAKYLLTRDQDEGLEFENNQFQFVPGLVKQTRSHQMQGCDAPMRYAGWLDHVGCVWRVGGVDSLQDSRAEYTLMITKIGRESEDCIFEGAFEFKVMFAQCFQISDNMNKDASSSQAFRILVFTTDMIYQLHVTIVEHVAEEPNQQKQIHIVRDDKSFAPICSNQVNFTCAKQHPSGMIIAAGSQSCRAQAVSLWLSSKIENLAYAPFTVNPMSYLTAGSSNKRSKKVECPQEGIVSSLFNILSGVQQEESVTDICFDTAGSQIALLITDIKSPLLSKINFYSIKRSNTQSLSHKVTSILTQQEQQTLSYRCTISLKHIFDQVRQILEFPSNFTYRAAEILPNHITYEGEATRLYLANGMIIQFCMKSDLQLEMRDILLSPVDRGMQIQNLMSNQKYNKELSTHFVQDNKFSNLNPFFPSNCEYLDYKGDEQALQIFRLGAAQALTQFEVVKACSHIEKEWIHEYMIVSRPKQGQHIFYVRRSREQHQPAVTSQYSLPDGFAVQSLQVISGTKVNILSVDGQCIKLETQTKHDILCQFLNLKERFENQNHQKTFNQTPFNQVENGNLQSILTDLNLFLDIQFNNLRIQIANTSKQSKISVIKQSKLYKFLEDLLEVQRSTTTNRCMSTDAFYLKKNNCYIDFISHDDPSKVDKLMKIRVNQEIKNQAKVLMLQIIETYFVSSIFEGASSEQQQENEIYEKVDHREAEHKDLQLSKYSVKGQVQYSLLMGFLTHILKPYLQMKVFAYDAKSKNLVLNKALVNAQKEIQSNLSILQALSIDMLASQTSSLFRSLRLLISLLVQGLAFFQTSLVQNQSERLATLNQNIMIFEKYLAKRRTHNHNSQTLIFNSEQLVQKADFQKERSKLLADVGGITLSEYLIQGPQSGRVMKIIETYITYDQSFIDDQILKNYPLFLKPEITELILSRKYLERASQVLSQMTKPGDFARDNEYRQQILNQALNCLLKNTINTDLETSLKLLMENYLYVQAIVFCLNKAQDTMQTQKFLISQSSALVQSQVAQPQDEEDEPPAVVNVDEKIQVLEVDKLDCFTFIVEMLEVVIVKLARQSKEIKALEFHKNNICKPINITALQQPENVFLSLFCRRTYPRRARPASQEAHRAFGPSGNSHASDFFGDLYPAFALPAQLSKVSQFTAIKVFEKQLQFLEIPDLIKLKNDILDLISSKEDLKPRQDEEAQNFGLDLLHRGIFQLLMKNDLVEDLFKINSPYLQSFIENEMWMYGPHRQVISVGNIHQDADATLEARCHRFKQILEFTSKHFMVLQQPLGLFSYLFEVLIQAPESGEHEKYRLSIADRITWLQKAMACIDDASISKCRFSSELGMKRERIVNVVKLHQIQKLMVDKLNKNCRRTQEIENEQAHKQIMQLQEKFNYYPIFEIQELFDVANDFNMFGIQLRIISLLHETSPDQGVDACEARAIQSEYAWSGFIRNNYLQKCLAVQDKKLLINQGATQAFKEKLKRFMRVLENVDKQFLAFEILELTQKYLKEQKVNFDCFFMKELYWLTDLLIPYGSSISDGAEVFETFNQILKNQLELKNHKEMHLEIQEEPMKFIYPCMTILKLSELKIINSAPQRLLCLEAERLSEYFRACFSGDLQLLYTKETIMSYKQFELKLDESIKKIKNM